MQGKNCSFTLKHNNCLVLRPLSIGCILIDYMLFQFQAANDLFLVAPSPRWLRQFWKWLRLVAPVASFVSRARCDVEHLGIESCG